MRGSERRAGWRRDKGTASVEYLVILATVAISFAAAAVPLGALLLDYHRLIERVLSLPIP
jgi:hypothetical protein